LIQENPKITAAEMVQILPVTSRTIERILSKLIDWIIINTQNMSEEMSEEMSENIGIDTEKSENNRNYHRK
jgi:predicted HTH transcriptional regulator